MLRGQSKKDLALDSEKLEKLKEGRGPKRPLGEAAKWGSGFG